MSDQIKPVEPCDCGGLTKVLETRQRDNFIYRRRKCLKCGVVFPTYESRIKPDNKFETKFKNAQLKRNLIDLQYELDNLLSKL